MAVHVYRRLLIATVLWPVPILTSRRFDASYHPFASWLYGYGRSLGLIRYRYYGRA